MRHKAEHWDLFEGVIYWKKSCDPVLLIHSVQYSSLLPIPPNILPQAFAYLSKKVLKLYKKGLKLERCGTFGGHPWEEQIKTHKLSEEAYLQNITAPKKRVEMFAQQRTTVQKNVHYSYTFDSCNILDTVMCCDDCHLLKNNVHM